MTTYTDFGATFTL